MHYDTTLNKLDDMLLYKNQTIYYENITINLFIDLSSYNISKMGLSITHDNTVQGKFIDFLEKVVIIELSLVFLFTAVSVSYTHLTLPTTERV